MLALLRNVPLFSGLEEKDLRLLQQMGVRRTFPKHTVLIQEGSHGDSLYLIISGRVKVFLDNQEGKEITLALLGPGDFVGEMALIDDEPRSAGVVTLDTCVLMVFSRADFRHTLAHNPSLSINLMKSLTHRLRDADRQIKSLALLDVYGRVARTLLQLARPVNGQMVISERLTHKDIAGMVGASREMVSRIFKHLTTAGHIRVVKRQIIVNEQASKLAAKK
jgi:CRP/FNR family cyclic AMP-dependent transcriptional regulator